jgi:hypothetical protein
MPWSRDKLITLPGMEHRFSGPHLVGVPIENYTKLHGLSPRATLPTERLQLVGEVIADFCG